MTQSICYRAVGPTQVMSVINAASYITVTASPGEMFNYVGFTNVGTSPVIVAMADINQNPPLNAFPTVPGQPQPGIVIPPLMQAPMLIACPNPNCTVAAISNSATASLVYVTPMGNL